MQIATITPRKSLSHIDPSRTIEWSDYTITKKRFRSLKQHILRLWKSNRRKIILLKIYHLNGGDYSYGLAFHEFIRHEYDMKLYTLVAGEVFSAGLLFFLSGEKRFMTRNSTLFIHSISKKFEKGERITFSQMLLEARDMKNAEYKYARIISDSSIFSQQQVRTLMQQNKTFTANECVRHGLANRLLDSIESL